MTDPNRHVPTYHDPYGGVGTSNNVAVPNEFLDISVDDYEQPNGVNMMFNQPSIADSQYTPFIYNPFGAEPSSANDQSDEQNAEYIDPGNSALENLTQLFEGQDPPLPSECSFCQVLRNVVHIRGTEETTKLEIHGRIGIVCHAILEICTGNVDAPNREYHAIDFCKKSIYDVKEFLVKYFEDRASAYCFVTEDPLQEFYDALCVRSYRDDIHQASPRNLAADANQPEAQSNEVRPRKKNLHEQMEYIATLSMKDLAKLFHLRETDAAKSLGVGRTVVQKIARNGGLIRWPYRQVKHINKRIRDIVSRTDPADTMEKAAADAEIQRLQRKKAQIYSPYQ